MRIERRFTTAGKDPYESIGWLDAASSEIRNPDGSVVFRQTDIQVPKEWSQVACDILAQKYFRKAGIAAKLKAVEENTVPSWLWRSVPDEKALAKLPEEERYGGETSAKHVFDRLAGTWTYWGWKGGYFDTEEDARAYFDEMRIMLARQMAAPNSPQWFNTGLHWAYGIDGPAQGHFYVDFKTGKLVRSKSAYEHPQPHACFIQSVGDDLVNEGGIMDLWVREARLFKYGSGTGSNFSKLRGEGEPPVRRRPLLRPDELPEDRRPGRRRHQVRRHDPPRRQDGDPSTSTIRTSSTSSTGRWSRNRRLRPWSPAPSWPNQKLNAVMQACNGDGRARGRGPLRPQGEPAAEEGDRRRPQGDDPRELRPARYPVRPPGLFRDRVQDL